MTRRIIQIYRGTTAQNDAFTGSAGELTMDTTRKELRVHDGLTVGGKVVSLTPGFIAPFAGSTAPDGWLICDGSEISRTTYARLFSVIGTTYGAGDGNSTFNIPNYSGAKLLKNTNADLIADNNQKFFAEYGKSGDNAWLLMGDDSGTYGRISCENGSHSGNYSASTGTVVRRYFSASLSNNPDLNICIKY